MEASEARSFASNFWRLNAESDGAPLRIIMEFKSQNHQGWEAHILSEKILLWQIEFSKPCTIFHLGV
jgi:hypothetical protein